MKKLFSPPKGIRISRKNKTIAIYDQKKPYDPYIFFIKAVRSDLEDQMYCSLRVATFHFLQFQDWHFFFFFSPPLCAPSRNLQLTTVIFCVIVAHPADTRPV